LGRNGRGAIFLDRDGTLIDEVGYVNDLARVKYLPGAAGAVRRINESGYLTFLVTNQSGIARRIFDIALLDEIHAKIASHLAESGAKLDGIYYCPHLPDAPDPRFRIDCDCRKPHPGMLLNAAREHELDLARSWMIGDSSVDLEAARGASVRSVMVLTGYGRGEMKYRVPFKKLKPEYVAADLPEAVEWILAREEEGS